MIRISKLTDYAIVILTEVARCDEVEALTARELAESCRLPLPTTSKILKVIARAGLVTSQRGAKGGYHLARPSHEIPVVEIIRAMEGPIAVTECSALAGDCDIEVDCPVKGGWRRINEAVRGALSDLTLADLVLPAPREPAAIQS